MNKRTLWPVLIALFLLPVFTARADQAGHDAVVRHLMPRAGDLLHGVYPGGRTGNEDDIRPLDVKAYERAVGQRVAWVEFSHNWFQGHAFPAGTARWIRARGSVPYIRLMMRSNTEEDRREPRYTLAAIAGGEFDADLAAWGRAAAAFGTPLIAEFGTEVNGEWFSWNGRWNGRSKGGANFIAAYRHIIDVVRAGGADNIVWVFHVNHESWPNRRWNRIRAYYPGDGYVDWLAISVYSMLGPNEDEPSVFRSSMDRTVARLGAVAPGKPVIVAEFGTDVNNRREDAAAWADRALSDMLDGRWPGLIGFSWWNETWENDDEPAHDTDLRVQSDPALAAVFRRHLKRGNVITRP